MSLHQMTQKLTPQQANYIPAGKYIYTDETFQLEPPKYVEGEAFARMGKELVPAHFSYGHHNPNFTPMASPSLPMNYGTYIYNSVTGYQ
jgi:hypothetical protein